MHWEAITILAIMLIGAYIYAIRYLELKKEINRLKKLGEARATEILELSKVLGYFYVPRTMKPKYCDNWNFGLTIIDAHYEPIENPDPATLYARVQSLSRSLDILQNKEIDSLIDEQEGLMNQGEKK